MRLGSSEAQAEELVQDDVNGLAQAAFRSSKGFASTWLPSPSRVTGGLIF